VRWPGYATGVRDFFRRHPKVAGYLLGFLVLLVCGAAVIVWEMGYECVRWTNRIEFDTEYGGGTYTVKVCAETRPRWGENVGK
jgi:hypothetical protein